MLLLYHFMRWNSQDLFDDGIENEDIFFQNDSSSSSSGTSTFSEYLLNLLDYGESIKIEGDALPDGNPNELVVLDTHRLYPAGRIIHIFDITSSTPSAHKSRQCCGGDQGPSDFLSVWAGVYKVRSFD